MKQRSLPLLPKQRRRRRLIAAGVAITIVVLWSGLAVGSALNGRTSALAGLDRLELIRDGFEIDQLETGELTARLSAASDDFASAQSNLRALWVTPLRIVPWVGTQIRSADALSNSAAIVSDRLASATTTVLTTKEDTQAGTITKADAADRLLALIIAIRREFAALELGPSSGLIDGLTDARRRFADELVDLDATLTDAEVATAGMTEFLSGPTTYLLLSANTSEMRVGSGRFLIAGPVTISDGDIEVGDLIAPEELLLPEGTVPITDPDVASNWAQLAPTTDLRNLGSTPRFDVTAPLAADMWEAATGQRVDGVLVIDPIALQAVLGAGDGVSVDGMLIDASNVVSHIVLDQYWEDDKPTRRLRQQELAAGALSAAIGPGVDLIDLVNTLQTAVAGRHILAWSDSPVVQAAWEVLGADGGIDTGSLMISVVNEGFNKLDTFLELKATARSTAVPGGRQIDLTIDIRNTAGPGLPDYVLGPYPFQGVAAGTYQGILLVNLPGNASQIDIEGPGVEVILGRDGPTHVAGLRIRVDSMDLNTHRVVFTLPTGSERITVMPSARVPPIRWTFDGVDWVDLAPRTLDLEAGDYGANPDGEVPVIGSLQNDSAVPPSPYVRLSGAGDEAVITWPVASADVTVVLWERLGSEEWRVLETALSPTSSASPLRVPVNPSAGPYCYRSSFSEVAVTLSSTSCINPGDS